MVEDLGRWCKLWDEDVGEIVERQENRGHDLPSTTSHRVAFSKREVEA